MTTTLQTITEKKREERKSTPLIQYMGHIEFGMLSKKCKNFGICRIEPLDKMLFNKNKKFEKVKTLALVRVFSGRGVDIYFLNKGMAEKIKKNYFSNANFLIGEDVNFLAECSCSNQKSTREGFIKKGIYHIEKRPWGYFVSFR